MNEKSPRWMWVLLGRVVSYAVLGALATAFFGALLMAVSGAVVGGIIDWSRRPLAGEMVFLGALFGADFGAQGGGIAGLIAFGILGFRSATRRSFLPPKAFLVSVVVGMSAATLAVMTSYFVGCALLWLVIGGTFVSFVNGGVFFIMFGAPAMMMCGAIAGALVGFRREKELQCAAPALPIEPI
ncbi:MAG: hypothetical protein KY445_04940 [Armatimonadetes bacterium]|nr:hypothetical protein [Armatimonadota bacterium]